jgi:hypothetical protein
MPGANAGASPSCNDCATPAVDVLSLVAADELESEEQVTQARMKARAEGKRRAVRVQFERGFN